MIHLLELLFCAWLIYRAGKLRGRRKGRNQGRADSAQMIVDSVDAIQQESFRQGWRMCELSREAALEQDDFLAAHLGNVELERQREKGWQQ